jgi:hypothetical protein
MVHVQTRSGAIVTVEGDVVLKVHRPGTDPRALRTRLHIAARIGSNGPLLAPLSAEPERVDGSRWRTRWPRIQPVPQVPGRVPWAEAAQLLARLHTEQLAEHGLPHGWPQRLRRALAALRHTRADAIATIRRAAAGLPPQAWRPGSPDRPSTLVHGDWHLGQLGRRTPTSPWMLIDVDDLGVGDPAWDLARPAGFWAAGLLPDADWTTFLRSYRNASGPAVPPAPADAWPVLEPFARAAVVQAAATGITHASDDTQAALIAACVRMPQLEKNSRPNPLLR